MIGNDEVHLWIIDLGTSGEDVETCAQILSPDEAARAGALRFEADRGRYIRGRAALRRILSGYLGIPAGRIEVRYNGFGKPSVAAVPIRFNFSNSSDLAICAVTLEAEIGVDVERVREVPSALDFARHHFSEEELSGFLRLSGRERDVALMRCMCRKESYLKALGCGLSRPLGSLNLGIEAQPSPWSSSSLQGWVFHDLSPVPEFTGSLAYTGPIKRIVEISYSFLRKLK